MIPSLLLCADAEITNQNKSLIPEKLKQSIEDFNITLFKTTIQEIIQITGNINFNLNTLWPWLHSTIQSDFIEGTKYLLEQGAYINIRDLMGYTPLHRAVCHASLDHIKLLLQHNADPSKLTTNNTDPEINYLKSVIDLAIYYDRPEVIDLCKQWFDLSKASDGSHFIPLEIAVMAGKFSPLKVLLQNNALGNNTPEELIIFTIISWTYAFNEYDYSARYFKDKSEVFKILLDYADIRKVRKKLGHEKLLTLDDIYKNASFETMLDRAEETHFFLQKRNAAKRALRKSLNYLENYEKNKKKFCISHVSPASKTSNNCMHALVAREIGCKKLF